jgi:hypothetical protein
MGEAKKFGWDRVGFGMVEERKSWYKEIKVCAVVVFDPKAINHQRKGDVAGDVTEETGGGGLVKTVWEARW